MDAQDILRKSQVQPGAHTWLARVPFGATAVLGGALLIFLKYLGWNQIYVTAAAIVLILGYAGSVYFVTKLRLREDQLADNCYYLGFLFTLVSLCWALWEFAQSSDVAAIVGNFGLALGSTIIGILLRVMINQARRDVLETEVDARMELAESVIRLRVQIDDATLAIQSFHQRTEQMAADGIRAATERASTALDESITKVGEASSRVLERIDTAFGEFTEHATQLNTASSGTVRGLRALLSRIEKIEAPEDIVLKRLEPAFASMDLAAQRLRERLDLDERALLVASENSARIGQRLTETVDALQLAQDKLRTLTAETAQASEAAVQVVKKSREMLAATEAALAGQSAFADTLREREEALRKGASADLEQVLSILTTHNQGLASELERWRRMTSQTGNTLADLADTVVTRLNGVTPATPLTPSEHLS